jgi:hypothetical protein
MHMYIILFGVCQVIGQSIVIGGASSWLEAVGFAPVTGCLQFL